MEQVVGRNLQCQGPASRWLSRAFRVLGYVGVAWLVVYIVLGLGEVEGWVDAIYFAALFTVGVGCCLAAFAAGELIRLMADLTARLR